MMKLGMSYKISRVLASCILVFVALHPNHAADYYWVGGSGNWSDITHWATTSGGAVQQNVVPSAEDNVYFDANSFTGPNQVVTINNQNVFCASMNWTGVTGNPRLVGPVNHAINVSGDLILTSGMNYAFLGNVRLTGNETGMVNLAGHRINKVLEIDGGANSLWTLTGDLQVDSLIEIGSGGFSTNGFKVSTPQLFIHSRSTTILDLGSSEIEITGTIQIQERDYYRNYPVVGIITDNLTLNPGTSTIRFTNRFPTLRIYGAENIQFNNLIFESSQGLTLFNYLRNLRWSFFYFNGQEPLIRARSIVANNNGIFQNQLQIDELVLSSGKSYRFESDRTHIIQQIDAIGTCGRPITIGGTRPTGNVTFQFNQNQNIEFVNLRNIHAMGTGAFVADNSVDLGNNNGWTINERLGTTLYWVGGKGRWTDPMHWSTTSGGAPGGCIPSPSDDVIFDQNSFSGNDSVIIDVDEALCRNMTWENLNRNPVFSSDEQKNLNIYGSLTLHDQMDVQLRGDVNFLTREISEIDMAGKKFLKDVYFLGTGTYDLTNDFETEYFVYLVSGHLRTNSFKMTFESFQSEYQSPRTWSLGASTIELVMRERRWSSLIDIYDRGFTLNAGTSTIEIYNSGRFRQYGDHNIEKKLDWFNIDLFGGFYFESSQSDLKAQVVRIFGNSEITGPMEIRRLHLGPGYNYEFWQWNPDQDRLVLDTLDASGQCDIPISLSSRFKTNQSSIYSDLITGGSNMTIEDLAYVGGSFTATRSIDYGNNTGWIIVDSVGRDLFWVGGTGEWNDPAHWSLSTGGPGGECVPTPIDNVRFDENSFSDPNQYVVAKNFYVATCRNFVWDGPPESVRFSRGLDDGNCCGGFDVYGSFDLRTPFVVDFYEVTFRGDESGHIINTSGLHIGFSYFKGEGDWTLTDPFNGRQIVLEAGTLNTNDQEVILDRIYIESARSEVNMNLSNSSIQLNGDGYVTYGTLTMWSGEKLTLDPGTSTIEFTNANNPTLLWEYGHPLYNVVFSSPTGTAYVTRPFHNDDIHGNPSYNKLQLNSDAFIYGDHTFDTLLFANGRSYTLESEKVQTVNEHLQIRGNNCIQLRLQATEVGNQSIIEMANGMVEGDFIQMQDQIARGGAIFLAGANSADISNNTGWQFESTEEFVDFGLLGDDVVFCQGETSLTINEEDLVGAISYQWNDGSTDPQLMVTNPGTYWLAAEYANNCVLIDSIRILEDEEFIVDLGGDQTLCPEQTLEINADLMLNGATYTWNDGFDNPLRTLDSSGVYSLQVELNGCTYADTMQLDFVEVPEFNIDEQGIVCSGDTVTLDADIPDVMVTWSTGSIEPILNVTQSGTYWLRIEKEGCEAADTLVLNFIEPVTFELGNDTTLCSGQELGFSQIVPVDNAVYSWTDSQEELDRRLSTTGTFTLTSDLLGCKFVDSISIQVVEIPELRLGAEEQLCDGEVLTLDATISGAEVLWSTGSTNSIVDFSQSGTYWVQITKEGCIDSDTFNLNFVVPPQIMLGNDITVCETDMVQLNASVQGASYTWSTGESSSMISLQADISQYVSVEAAFGRCAAKDSLWMEVKPLPMIDLGEDFNVCPGEEFELSVETDGDSFTWMDGNITDATRPFAIVGTYHVTATLDGCINEDEIQVSNFETHFISLGPDTLICDDVTLPINIEIPGGTYSWSDGSMDGSRELEEPGLYAVEVFDGNCYFEDVLELTTRECVYFSLFAPNVFSPNGDDRNDIFRLEMNPSIQIQNFSFHVFDRWGSLLFTTSDPNQGWDGYKGGQIASTDVYIYAVSMDYVDDNGPGSYKGGGDVLLIK